ncbi:MAG: PDZ domain-containing protein, partial [bacterium]
ATGTQESFYRYIRLNFFDYKTLKAGIDLQAPPLVWIGEVDSEGAMSDIRSVAPVMLFDLLTEFPIKPERAEVRSDFGITFGSIGINVDQNDWRMIKEVVPGSPAAKAGLNPGDMLTQINPNQPDSKSIILTSSNALKAYLDNIIANINSMPIEITYKLGNSANEMKINLIPKKTEIIFYPQNGNAIIIYSKN